MKISVKTEKNIAKYMIMLLVTAISLSFIGMTVSAQSSNKIDEQKLKKITVGIFTGDGYAQKNQNGVWSGVDVEITENIAQISGFDIEFKAEDSVENAFKDLDSGKINMLADIAKTSEREEKYLFSQYEQGTTGTSIFVSDSDTHWDYENIDQLKSMTFSCEKGNVVKDDFLKWCSQRNIQPNIVEYNSWEEAAKAVKTGEADGYIDGEDYLEGYRSILSFATSPYYYIFSKNNDDLKQQVDAALGAIYLENPYYGKELMEKYLKLTENRPIAFSRMEKDFISANPTIRVAVLDDDAPYFWENSKSPKGIVPEFYANIASVTGFHFVYKPYKTQSAAIAALKSGEADVIGIFSNGMTNAYNQHLSITKKYATANNVMITYSGTNIKQIKKIAIKERSADAIKQNLPDNLKNAEIINCSTAKDCFSALSLDKAEAVIIGMPTATYFINQRNSAAYTVTPLSSLNLELCGAVTRENHTLLTILNKGISSVAYTFDGIVAVNTTSKGNLQSLIAAIPAWAIMAFAVFMTVIVIMLIWTVVVLINSRRTKVAAVKAQADIEQRRVQAEASERNAAEKNAFFSNISHDMRTPLNAVIGFAGLGQLSETIEEKDSYLAKIRSSGELLNALINDTLTISKMSSGKLYLHPEPTKISEMFSVIIEPIKQAAMSKNIEFKVDCSGMCDKTVMIDSLNVQKIYMNLLSNAVKYTPDGGHVSLKIYSEPCSNKADDFVVEVADDGIGMSEDFIKHLYEPFMQEKRHGYESIGTGLGLSIVKDLVSLMGGTIDVKSIKEKGTRFVVRLHFDEVKECGAEGNSCKTSDKTSLNGKKILLCEDNQLNREIACALLKNKGITTVCAENGEKGVKLFSESNPYEYSAVLMDVRMPVMDGIDATKQIRLLGRSDAADVPIIAMTADAFAEDVQRCLDAGMNAHIAKPINPEVMFSTLCKYIK